MKLYWISLFFIFNSCYSYSSSSPNDKRTVTFGFAAEEEQNSFHLREDDESSKRRGKLQRKAQTRRLKWPYTKNKVLPLAPRKHSLSTTFLQEQKTLRAVYETLVKKLYGAQRERSWELISAELRKDPELLNFRPSKNDPTLLHYAVYLCSKVAVKGLLELGAKTNVTCKDLFVTDVSLFQSTPLTPLAMAQEWEFKEIESLLANHKKGSNL